MGLIMPKIDEKKLKEFIKNNFKIPSGNTNEITIFITKIWS